MKINRLNQVSGVSTSREVFSSLSKKISSKSKSDQISEELLAQRELLKEFCDFEEAREWRLEDEFSQELIDATVPAVKERLSDRGMSRQEWDEIRAILQDQLWEFGRLKEDLEKIVQEGKLLEGRMLELEPRPKKAAACLLYRIELEVKRASLEHRLAKITEAFLMLFLVEYEGRSFRDVLELRMRAVFASL